jgi:hypothetical protein
MSTRTTRKPVVNVIITEDQMRTALQSYVAAHCEANKIEADAKITIEAAKKAADEKLKPHNEAMKDHEAVIALYVEQHKAEFCEPHPRKKEIYGGHKIGLQTGQPGVVFIKPTGEKGKQTEEGFIMACEKDGSDLALSFLREIKEVDKDSIIGARRRLTLIEEDSTVMVEQFDIMLAELGAKIAQKENVVIDLNLQPEAQK